MSQQGLCGLMNPFITCESSFRGPFCEGDNSIFMTVYESKGAVWADESFVTCERSFGVYESTGAVGADESILHL